MGISCMHGWNSFVKGVFMIVTDHIESISIREKMGLAEEFSPDAGTSDCDFIMNPILDRLIRDIRMNWYHGVSGVEK